MIRSSWCVHDTAGLFRAGVSVLALPMMAAYIGNIGEIHRIIVELQAFSEAARNMYALKSLRSRIA